MGKAKRMQVYHHDNGDIEFRRLDIIGQSVTEMDNTGEPARSWVDYLQALYYFRGYTLPGAIGFAKGSIPADAVMPAYGRHFHLELHDILSDDQRPPDNDKGTLESPYITAVAETRVVEITKAAKPRSIYDKLTLILGAALFCELIIWGVSHVIGG